MDIPQNIPKFLSDSKDPIKIPWYIDFIINSVSGMTATCFTHPFDVVKNRMQMSTVLGMKTPYANSWDCTSGRLSFMHAIINKYRSVLRNSQQANLATGVAAGIFGAILGNPAEVALVRMTTDKALPKEKRRNYKNVFNALSRIAQEEGLIGLYVGLTPSIIQAVVVNAIQIETYSSIKAYLQNGPIKIQNELCLQISGAIVSGCITAAVSQPFDLVKTRMQSMKHVRGKRPEYYSILQALIKISRTEGFRSLWSGFMPYFYRITPQTVLIFFFMEKYYILYFKYVLGVEVRSKFDK